MMNEQDGVLLISCYELGHQPFGIAMPLAFLKRAGYNAEAIDLSVQSFDYEKASRARFAGISVPMHTALRLGVRVAEQIRAVNPDCHICFYGLYAILNSDYLLSSVADSVIGGEFEQELAAKIAGETGGGVRGETARSEESSGQSSARDGNERRIEKAVREARSVNSASPVLERLAFPAPLRDGLPGLSAYAKLELDGGQKLAGYTEASRGCLHLCTHCPIPPVYGGRFFVIPQDVVMEDIAGLVASGAEHITFGDPDFLNGPGHSLRLVRRMHKEFPRLTFDFTAKIEHLLRDRGSVEEFARLGCIFIVSAVESMSDTVLAWLRKGHTRADVIEAVDITRRAGVALRPSFVPFTPWATMADYADLLNFVGSQSLIYHVDPVQYAIRLLIPPGSLILEESRGSDWLGPLIEDSFSYSWTHPDLRMDALQRQVSDLVELSAAAGEDAAETFDKICNLTMALTGEVIPKPRRSEITRPPRLTESWFCCAEPTREQLKPISQPLSQPRALVSLTRQR
jgi:radical SAM superfamily enzyme YgiQ (UPF0313 family)